MKFRKWKTFLSYAFFVSRISERSKVDESRRPRKIIIRLCILRFEYILYRKSVS